MKEPLKDILEQAAFVQSNIRHAKQAVLASRLAGLFSAQSADALNKAKKAQRESLLAEGLLSSLCHPLLTGRFIMKSQDKTKSTAPRRRNAKNKAAVAAIPKKEEGGWFDLGDLWKDTWVSGDSLWKNLFFVFLKALATLFVFSLHLSALLIIGLFESLGEEQKQETEIGIHEVDYFDTDGSYTSQTRMIY